MDRSAGGAYTNVDHLGGNDDPRMGDFFKAVGKEDPSHPSLEKKHTNVGLKKAGLREIGPKDEPKRETWQEKRERVRKNNLIECCNICLFFIYLLFFSVAMLLEQSASSSRFADHIRHVLNGGFYPLERVENIAEMYTFMESTFVPAMYQNNTDTNLAVQSSRYLHPIDSSNRMMGVARIRQVRVARKNDCQVGPMFSNYAIPCYPKYDAGTADKNPFGPDAMFSWKEDPTGSAYAGYMAGYDAAGYMEFLSSNRTAAMITLQELRENNFLDIATRAVFIDFTVWNSNVGSYAIMRICSEFSPSGTAAHYVEVSILSEGMLKPGGLGRSDDWAAFLLVLIVMCFVIWYIVEEAQEAYEKRIGYLWDAWNVMDWINMFILIIAFVFRCLVWSEAASANIGRAQLANQNSFSSIRSMATKSELVRFLHAFNAVLLWAKCVKYFRHLPIVKVLIRTVWDSFKLFLPFLFMFSVAMVGFTMAYKIGFGDKLLQLTSFAQGVVFLGRAFLRDAKLMPVYHITPKFGALLILLFYITMTLVGMNVLLACVADALYRSKYQGKKGEQEDKNSLHEDEPLEELFRLFGKWFDKCYATCCPCIYYLKKGPGTELHPELAKQLEAGPDGNMKFKALNNGPSFKDPRQEFEGPNGEQLTRNPENLMIGDGGYNENDSEKPLTSEMLMRAIEHMSGRVLSEVQEVGIEIRSELHDVCERVAQMQMAVQELEWRTELVRLQQQEVI